MIKIKKISFKNHPIFGTQEISFCDKNNKPYNSIILIGENGSGKTLLLKYLYETLSSDSYAHASGDVIESVVELDIAEEKLSSWDKDSGIVYKIDSADITIFDNGNHAIRFISNGYIRDFVKAESDRHYISRYSINSVMSSVGINYFPSKNISGVTDQTLDKKIKESPIDTSSNIEQLFVDLFNQDNSLISNWVRNNPGMIVPDDIFDSLALNRFNGAYFYMFNGSITLDKVENNIRIYFKKNGNSINIHDLSSGEKQIIYRGAYLLRNIGLSIGAPIFIDEPEISMHPSWARKIYSFYRNLFSNRSSQKSQIFFATHSDSVIEEALYDSGALIISMNNGVASVLNKDSFILPYTTIAEIKYQIFNIATSDYHNQLYGYISNNLLHGASVKTTDTYLFNRGAVRRSSRYKSCKYRTLSTFIRNRIDHPNGIELFSYDELYFSIKSMIDVINNTTIC